MSARVLINKLKHQMTESEKAAYKKLAELPGIIKSIGKTYIDDVVTLLEGENEKIWKCINALDNLLE